MGFVFDVHVLQVAQLVQVLTPVVSAEQQLQPIAESSTNECLSAASIAAVGSGQSRSHGSVHVNLPRLVVAGVLRTTVKHDRMFL